MTLRLTAENVTHRFGALTALQDISFSAEPGRVTVLVGPSGCGKSTLLGLLGGMLQPSQGRITLDGKPPAECLNPLTYVFQDFALLPWRSVSGNVSLVLEDRLPAPARADRIREVLAATGLSDFADLLPKALSGGMRQRVGIARALAVRPACLLMDEPLSALDAQTRELLLEEFATLIANAGTTTIYVTHNLTEAVLLGQQIIVLSRRPGTIREIIHINRPVQGRAAADPELARAERHLWDLIRNDAATAEREGAGA